MFLKKTVRQLLIVLFIALIGLLATTGSVSFAPLGGTGTGPGGVGSTDGLSTLEIWVKGDTGVYSDSGCTTAASNGGTLGCWADQSGNGNDLNSSTSPTYQTGTLNSQPVIRNTASTSIRNTSFTQNDVSITLILVAQAANASQSSQYDSLMSMGTGTGDSFQIDFSATSGGNYQFLSSGPTVAYGTADTSPHILTLVIDGSNVNTFYDGGTGSSQSSTFTPDFTEFRLFANRGDNQFFVGDLAESILYLAALNSAERTLVENYLAAKYGIALSSGDKYAGDTTLNGDYDLDVAGIGQESDGTNTEAHSTGLVIQESGGTLANGEYLLAGHKTTANAWTTADVPGGVTQRWKRVWYLDKNSGSVDAVLSFDFSESGLGGTPSGSYMLLYSATNAFSFSDTGLSATISGDQVQFTVPDATLSNGYYALGTSNATTPEMDVQGNNTSINDGDTTPNTNDHTDFGSVSLGSTQDRTFTIQNTGASDLTLNGSPKVAVSGTNAGDFSVTAQPTSPVSSEGGTTTFTVRFTPSDTGVRTATLSISNDDSDENPYDFSIQGTGLEVGTGPGGVGTGDGSSTLEIWVKGDAGVYSDSGCTTVASNGGTVGCWADQSGNGNDLNSSTSPTYQTGIINSQPVIRNTASTSIRDASFTQNDVSITLILAAQAASALQSDNFDSLMSMGAATGDSFQIDFSATSGGNYQFNKVSGGAVAYGTADTSPHILTLVIDGSNVNTFYDGGTGSSQSSTFTPDFTEFRLFANRGDNQFFVGDLAESILYLTALNSAERTLVENYLAAKYGIALSSGDKYAGDTTLNGDYDLDVAGIGQESDGSNTEAHSAGIILNNNTTYLVDDGDYVLVGHATTSNANTSNDVIGSVTQRWTRVWYLDITDGGASTNGNLKISFDFSEGGMSGTPANASNYRLLTRSGTTGNFSEVTTVSTSIENTDQVAFVVAAANLTDGYYYTFGTTNAAISPTVITLENLTARSTSPLGLPGAAIVGLAGIAAVALRRRSG